MTTSPYEPPADISAKNSLKVVSPARRWLERAFYLGVITSMGYATYWVMHRIEKLKQSEVQTISNFPHIERYIPVENEQPLVSVLPYIAPRALPDFIPVDQVGQGLADGGTALP